MNNSHLTKFLISLSCSLLFSTNALANPKNFELQTEEGNVVGEGIFEEMPYSTAKVTINLNNSNYTGSGTLTKKTDGFIRGMQNNRGALATKQMKKLSLLLNSLDNSTLSCVIQKNYGQLSGKCIDSSNVEIKVVRVES